MMFFKNLPPVLWALFPVTVLGPALTCVSQRIVGTLFIVSAIAAIITDAVQRRAVPKPDQSFTAVFGAFILWGLVSVLWSVTPGETITKAGQLLLILGPTAFLIPIIGRMDARQLTQLGYMLLAGLGGGMLVFAFEAATAFRLYASLHDSIDLADRETFALMQNKPAVLADFWFIAALPFLLVQKRWWIALALGVLVYALTFTSQSDSAQLILKVVPIFALLVFLVPPRLMQKAVIAALVVLCLAMPAITRGVYLYLPWRQMDSMPHSIEARIQIWDQAARRTMEKPLLGWGLNTSPALPNRGEHMYQLSEKYPLAHLHPHNAPIQIWFELGLVGAAFMLALMVVFYRKLSTLTLKAQQIYAIFTLGTVFAYTLSIWGIWQSWFLSALCFTGLMAYAAVRYIKTAPEGAV